MFLPLGKEQEYLGRFRTTAVGGSKEKVIPRRYRDAMLA